MATDLHPGWQHLWSHREQLLKVARRRSLSTEDAEDAVQEAMLRAAENPHLDLDDPRLGAWLTTVTMRLCVDRYRQVNREAEVRRIPRLVAPGPVPVDEAVCDRAEAKWLAFRSRELPARQAEALRLKAQDRDVGQVAQEMGLSYEAVESLLARARRTLRNSLAGTLALALWLCGRGRTQAGGNAQMAVAASTAATLAVVGLTLPFTYEYEPDRSGPPPRGVTSVAVDPVEAERAEETAGRAGAAPSASPSPGRPAPASAKPSPSGLASVLPEVFATEVPVPRVPVPDLPVPAVPAVPAPQVPQVPQVEAPDLPDVPVVEAPEVPDVPRVPLSDALSVVTGRPSGDGPVSAP
ncbi:sigma-70 family RNA polymerase sigma factor [Streptomyces sp. NPDC003027]